MTVSPTAVLYKRFGRGRAVARWHLIGPDGNTPLCGQRIVNHELWAIGFTSDTNARAAACPRCKAIRSNNETIHRG